ncbi:BatA domain-containing protein [Pontibacter harenae]|uniref:BatA domain-containing protein n=1 Tax=Pontibacter harenae TaxID=2894083 RepID=UPI001E46A939|nr:BatA domain-containing protein [Pontibacter harenae]MCC9167123.1 BatA domain-containing protein [Pontibacter harenae]
MALLYPSFLYALLATAVPVILHLVQLRRAKRIEFSNVRFIQASKDLTASQQNLKQLLILLCRILFIVFLVLAFAQPFLPATESAGPVNVSEVAMVVDNSYSMQQLAEGKDVSLLTTSVDRAKTIANIFPASTSFRSLANGQQGKGLMAGASDVENFLDELDFTSNSFQIPSADRVGAEHLFLFSDFQKSTFSPQLLSDYKSSKAQVHVVPIEAANTQNVFIDSLYLEDELIRPGVENILHIVLYNTGDEMVEGSAVKLVIEDQQVAALSLDLPAKQATEATVSFSIREGGVKRAYVAVDDYPVEFDNMYHFVLAPSQIIEITEVAASADNSLQRLYNSEAFFRHATYSPGNINYARASTSNIMILNGLQTMPAALATTVANFVKAGGAVVVIPGVSAEASSYAGFFQELNIPSTYSTVTEGAKTALAVPDPANPFFRSIFSEYEAKMQMPSATRNLLWSRASEDIMKFRGGAPFLSRFDRGAGKVYLMAAPLDERFNDLQNHALFVPIMYRLAIESYKQEQQLAYNLQGETLRIAVGPTTKEGIFKLAKDSVEFIPQQQVRGGALYFDVPAEMDEAGLYRLQLNDSTVTILALNYSKEESQLEQYTPNELRTLLGQDSQNIHVYDYGDEFDVKGEFEKSFFGVKLWKYCLILCLFFLIAEIALIRLL